MAKTTVEKQILRLGQWKHSAAPNGVLNVDKEYIQRVAENYKGNPFVPVVRGHASYEEAERDTHLTIARNIKEVEARDDGLYAKFDIDEAELNNYNDVSASIAPDYEDHETGKSVGPVLKHIAMVINPYIKKLKPFVALGENTDNYFILLSEISMADNTVESVKTETEEIVEEVTVVEETEATVEEPTVETEVVTEETKEESKPEDVVEEVQASDSDELRKLLAEKEVELSEYKSKERKASAEQMYSDLLKEGKVTPAVKAEFVQLAEAAQTTEIQLSDKSILLSDALKNLFTKLPVLVNLEEQGVNLENLKGAGAEIGLSETTVEKRRKTFFKENPKATEEEFLADLKKNREILKRYETE